MLPNPAQTILEQADTFEIEAEKFMRSMGRRSDDEKRVLLPLISSMYAAADSLRKINEGLMVVASWQE